ncbi:MAG: M24 family metallopeptidase, partial [Sarcina sp.]
KWINPGKRMVALYINTKGEKKLIVNELFPVEDNIGVELVWYKDTENPIEVLSNMCNKNEVLGIDKDWPSHFLIKLMDNKAAKSFVNGSPIIDRIRMIKDEEEIELMKEASRVNDYAMSKIVEYLNEINTEKEVVNVLGEIYEKEGAQGFSFSPIVAYGANAADPHCVSGNNKLQKAMGIIVDTGCRKDYYCSDMTRTFFYGEPTEHQKKIFNIVLEANKKAIEMIKPGVRFCDIDRAARSVIEGYGYGEYFTHRTGHSIGLETHDFGDVSSVNEEEVKPGMIFSVEPGIYLQGDMGVRIEDLVLVTDDGHEVLNKYPKELHIIK